MTDLIKDNSDKPRNLFKYKAFDSNSYYKALFEGKIYLAAPTMLNDPFDCKIPIPLSVFGFRDDIINEEKIIEYIDETTRICSLTSVNSNLLLWSHYADSHKGFCIEYSFEKLQSFLENKYRGNTTKNKYVLSNVEYPRSKEFPVLGKLTIEEAVEKAFTTKSVDWEYENEYRIVHTEADFKSSADFLALEPGIITGIYYGLYADKKNISESSELAEHFDPNIKFYKAEKVPNRFDIKFKQI